MDVKRIYIGWRAFSAALLISLLIPSFGLAETILVGPTTFPVESGQTNQFIVRFSSDTSMSPRADGTKRPDQAVIDRLANITGLAISHKRQMGGGQHVLEIPSSLSIGQIKSLAAILMSDPNIISAEPDRMKIPFLTPNDPSYGDQWHYGSNADDPGAVNLPTAWDISTGNSSVIVAILDTGLLPHADIDSNILDGSGRVLPGYDMISTDFVANDGGGRDNNPTDTGDWTAAGYCSGGSPSSNSSWHGTHVAGTIGANTNNSLGVAGVDWNAKLLPVRVLGKCGGYTSDITDGILWAAGLTVSGITDNPNPAHVINMSLGGSGPCSAAEQAAINAAVAAGTVVVIAAGNSGADVVNFSPGNCSNIITVAAADRDGGLSYYSNYGTLIDITAPGGEILPYTNGILSTLDSGTTTAVNDNSYAWYQGTSMATPHVAGIAALMMGANQALSGSFLTPAQVLQHIQATSATFPVTNGAKPGGLATDTCTTTICGSGLIDTAQALAAVTTLPTTSAGSAQTVDQSVLVTLDASASSDDGTITGYAWTQTAGTTVTLSSTTAISPTFTSPATAGTLTFQVAVTDDVNLTSTATVDITVGAPPGPYSEAGSFQYVTLGDTVTLNGSTSSAGGGTITSWLWQQTDGAAVTLATPTAATTTFTAPASNQAMTFRLTITTDTGVTYIDTVGVSSTSTATPNTPPTANAGSDQMSDQGVLVSLDGSVSNDPDGTIASYQWTQIDGTTVTLTGATTATPSFTTPNSGGALSFKLVITDNNGIDAVDYVGIGVRSSTSTNDMPVADAGINQSVTQSSAVTLNASGSSDTDGTIASYQWTQLAGTVVTLTGASSSSASFTAPNASGALSFMLAITDNQGGSAIDFVSVSVISNNTAPLAHAGSDRTVTVGGSITLDGTASSDSDGSISAYSWILTDGSGVTLTNASTSTPTVATTATGTVTFQLQVTDNEGATAIDTVAVFINAVAASANEPGIIDPNADSNNDGIINSLALSLGLDPYVPDGDSDGDGISDIIEIGNINNPIDSDNDGVIDAIEPGELANNASILGITVSPTAANSLNTPELAGELIRIVSNDQYPLSIKTSKTGQAIHSPAKLVSNNNRYHYPFGLYAFRVHTGSASTASVSIYFPPGTDFSQPLVIRKQDSQGQWRDFPYGSIDYSNHSVTLALVDNDEFDLDPRRGTILDPVGPGVMVTATASSAESENNNGGGVGAGLILILLIRWIKRCKASKIAA